MLDCGCLLKIITMHNRLDAAKNAIGAMNKMSLDFLIRSSMNHFGFQDFKRFHVEVAIDRFCVYNNFHL